MAANQGTSSHVQTDVINLSHDPASVCVVALLQGNLIHQNAQ
jgi:hypothetical protein